jgi:hypothetical protein
MNITQSIKLFSVAALMSVVWGCSSSKQVAKSSTSEVYDDMYASTNEARPATLTSRERYYQAQEEEYINRNPEYRGQNNNNQTAQGTDEYYSQNWINSRGYYQNQTPYSNNGYGNYNNGYNNGGYNSPFNNYGFNNWYGNPGISFGMGYGGYYNSPWNSWGGYSSFGFGNYYSPFGYSGYYSPFNSYAYNPFGYGYSPYGYGYNSYYDPYGRGYGNTYVYNYGSGVTGANGNYSNPVPRTPVQRNTYSSSAYNGDYNANRGGNNTSPRGSRTDAGYTTGNTNSSGNSDYYSRPRRDNGYTGGTTAGSNSSNANTRSNSSWNWSNNNNNSNSSNSNSSWGANRSTTTTSSPSWGGSSSGGSSGGSSGSSGGGGGGGSRGPR